METVEDTDKEVYKKENNNTKNDINIVREFSNCIWKLSENPLDAVFGIYYMILHYIFIVLGCFVLLFETNVVSLTVVVILLTLDGMANVVMHDCPLTTLEQKYLKTTMSGQRKHFLQNCGIMFKCNDIYESQLELIINIWSLFAAKILILLTLQFFNKKIVNA